MQECFKKHMGHLDRVPSPDNTEMITMCQPVYASYSIYSYNCLHLEIWNKPSSTFLICSLFSLYSFFCWARNSFLSFSCWAVMDFVSFFSWSWFDFCCRTKISLANTASLTGSHGGHWVKVWGWPAVMSPVRASPKEYLF